MKRNFDYKSTKALQTGASGFGKSTFQIHFVRTFRAKFKFVFDHKHQFAPALGGHSCTSAAELWAAVTQRGGCIFNPSRMFPGKLPEAFKWFCQWSWLAGERLRGTKLLAFDEAGLLLPSNRTRYEEHPIRKHMETGREFEWNLNASAQSANQLAALMLNQMNRIIAFGQRGEKANQLLISEFGFDRAELRKLEKSGVGHYVSYDGDAGRFERGKLQIEKGK